MPKSKKKKKADFQKVKLKVGKKLTKGDNVTNLSFKTRQINLTQSIRDGSGGEATTRRKLGIQDLLRGLGHHGVSARVNAVAGVKELWLESREPLLEPSNKFGYGAILQRLSTMFIDNEAVVRHSVIGLFKVMVSGLAGASRAVTQGFPVRHVVTHLCVALSHVHEDIRLDGLLILDSLVTSLPRVTQPHCGDLLARLLALLNSPGNPGLGARGTAVTQKLSLNPDSRLPVMRFRGRVLQRVLGLLMIVSRSKDQEDSEVIDEGQGSDIWSAGADHRGSATLQDTAVLPQQNRTRFMTLLGGTGGPTNLSLPPETLQTFVSAATPTLVQCWREARASVDTHTTHTGVGDNVVVTHDSAIVMTLVASIFQVTVTLCQGHGKALQQDILPSLALQLEQLFMPDFPLSLIVRPQEGGKNKKKNKGEDQTPFSLDALNLSVCCIISSLLPVSAYSLQPTHSHSLQAYLRRRLSSSPSPSHTTSLARCLCHLAGAPHNLAKFLPCFKTAIKLFQAATVTSPHKCLLYNVFSQLCRNWHGEGEGSGPGDIVRQFCPLLPDLLLEVIESKVTGSSWTLDILTLMTRTRGQGWSSEVSQKFMEALPRYLAPEFLSHLSDRETHQLFACVALGTPLTTAHYRQILEVVRHDSCLSRRPSHSTLAHVLTCVFRNIRQIVPLSSESSFTSRSAEQETRLAEYLSFVCSLCIGIPRETLDQVSPRRPPRDLHPPHRQVTLDLDPKSWGRHTEVARLSSHEMSSLRVTPDPSDPGDPRPPSDPMTLTRRLQALWVTTFKHRACVPVSVVFSLVTFLCDLQGCRGIIEGELVALAVSVIPPTLHSLLRPSDDPDPGQRSCGWQVKVGVVAALEGCQGLLEAMWPQIQGDAPEVSIVREFLLSQPKVKQKIDSLKLT